MEQISDNLFDVYLLALLLVIINLFIYPLYSLFIAFLFPNSVATHQYEVHSFFKSEFVCVRIRCYRLLFRLKMLTLLVFKVTETTGEIKISINTAFCDGRTRFCNSIYLCLALRFMIYAHLNSFSTLAHDTSRITCICDVNFLLIFVDINNVRCASN